jgi:NAD-dependent dihydropyrimidine dehydrogenase PreA subunit
MTDFSKYVKEKNIIFCRCGGDRIDIDLLHDVDEHLRNKHVIVTCLSDLCGLVQQKRELLSNLFKSDAEYMIIGCYPRTMNLLFGQIDEQTTKPEVSCHINMIDSPINQVIEQINSFCNDEEGNFEYKEIIDDSGWPSWYPVIDYSRCTACGQCADFCLFGVYEKSENRITVTNPQGCKNNCPACARICPSSAIIFPKYKNGGAVGGSDEIDEFAEQQRQAQDLESFLGADIYSALEKRKLKRKSIIRDEEMKTALSERDNAVKGI